MKILLTGGNGFLGRVIHKELCPNHQVFTLGRGASNTISCDLKSSIPSLPQIDIVVHAAGKAHMIPKTEQEKEEFYHVNLTGTEHLLLGLKDLPKLLVFISTVAVYGREEGEDISENHPLLGDTPYAQSKIKAENLILDWGKENKVNVVILRLPLIVGPNPPGNLGAILKALKRGYYFRLGSGNARKSMVLASDVARLIPSLLNKSGTFNLTDGIHPDLAQLDQKIAENLEKTVRSIPVSFLRIVAKFGDFIPFFPLNTYRLDKLSNTLIFSDQKAREELNWNPNPVLENLFKD